MATTIRLTRMGRKKRPFYRLVVLDSRKRRDGAYLANLGYYNPFADPHEVDLRTDDIIGWLSKGATLSETARSLLKSQGVMYKYSLVKQGLDQAEVERLMEEWAARADQRRRGAADAAAARRESERKARVEREEEARAAAAKVAEADAAGAADETGEAGEASAAADEGAASGDAPAEEAPAEAAAAEGGDDTAAADKAPAAGDAAAEDEDKSKDGAS